MTVSVTINVDERAWATLDAVAAGREVSRERILEEAVADCLAFEARQIELIQEGLAAADRGEFATDEEVADVFGNRRIESDHADPYLAYLDVLLGEWNTPEDAAAFDEL